MPPLRCVGMQPMCVVPFWMYVPSHLRLGLRPSASIIVVFVG